MALLSGCATTDASPHKTPDVPAARKTFEHWHLQYCHLVNQNNGITISTDGTQSHQTLRFRASLPLPARTPPLISLLGVGGQDLKQAGRARNWSFELPNSPFATAQMMAGRVYVVIEYTPVASYRLPTPQPRTATFSMAELPEALLEMHKKCENR